MTDDLSLFMAAIRLQESGGNYSAFNPDSRASGAYQFLDSTFHGALRQAGLGGSIYITRAAYQCPVAIQDAAARALMGGYYATLGHSWFNVAEAWYGGPGAVGHPNRGGGPGYPNVGQYATDVMVLMRALGAANAITSTIGGGAPANGGEWDQALKLWSSVSHIYGTSLPNLNIDLGRARAF